MAKPDECLIAAHKLSRVYGEWRVLHDIDVTLHRGEVLGFLGPNGAGKSTTMRILSGVLAPSSGTVHIGGIDLLEHPIEAKRRLGYLPEQPPVYRELTVDEFLRYCARLHRVAPAQTPAALARAKDRCGLGAVGARLIGSLSKGYQQRLGIAQAIIHSPAVVILDEPTVGLDPIQIREIRDLIRELRSDHGVLLSTHILPEVQAVCDRVILINGGRIVLDSALGALPTGAGGWRVRLRRPPPFETLQSVTGVQRVEMMGAQCFLLSGSGFDPEAFVRRCVEADWGLLELAPQDRSLEEVFLRVTSGDVAMEAA
jgi:ABC-2 type transport system ATP-binding protein